MSTMALTHKDIYLTTDGIELSTVSDIGPSEAEIYMWLELAKIFYSTPDEAVAGWKAHSSATVPNEYIKASEIQIRRVWDYAPWP